MRYQVGEKIPDGEAMLRRIYCKIYYSITLPILDLELDNLESSGEAEVEQN
jgi:hypothetical protein